MGDSGVVGSHGDTFRCRDRRLLGMLETVVVRVDSFDVSLMCLRGSHHGPDDVVWIVYGSIRGHLLPERCTFDRTF